MNNLDMLKCPNCCHYVETEKYQKYEHNTTYHAPCPKCNEKVYFKRFLFKNIPCFYCGMFRLFAVESLDQYYEGTGNYTYHCDHCGAMEGDPSKKLRSCYAQPEAVRQAE